MVQEAPPLPPGTQKLQFVERVSSLPVVISAASQLGAFYGYYKDKNRFVKFGLETAETGLKLTTEMALPVVHKLEGPVSALDSLAAHQLDKIAHTYPIITKSTPEVVEEVQQLLDATVKPTVDRISSVTQYGKDKVTGVKNYTTETVNGVKERAEQTVKPLITFSEDKIRWLTSAEYSQIVQSTVDKAVDMTDNCVEYYLPANLDNDNEKALQDAPSNTFMKMGHLSKKASRRIYRRSKVQVENIVIRSAEAMKKLTHTVDLIEYAKTQFENGANVVGNGLVQSKNRLWSAWDSNKTISPPQQSEISAGLISSGQRLTSAMKKAYDSLPGVTKFMPQPFLTAMHTARETVHDLYHKFHKVNNISDLASADMMNFRSGINRVQELSMSMLSYTAAYLPYVNRVIENPAPECPQPVDNNEETEESDDDDDNEEAEDNGDDNPEENADEQEAGNENEIMDAPPPNSAPDNSQPE